MDIKTGVKLHS